MARHRFWSGKLEDDRGVAHRQRSVRTTLVQIGDRGSRFERTAQSLVEQRRKALRNSRSDSRTSVGIALGLISILATILWIAESGSGKTGHGMLLVLGVFLLIAALMFVIGLHGARYSRKILAVRFPLCLVCGYVIAALDPDADGCTVCPECGAAWNIGPESADSATGNEDA
ncbi:MAG: hypothetical protein RIB32_01625 [Phycisphaerales bacterium]